MSLTLCKSECKFQVFFFLICLSSSRARLNTYDLDIFHFDQMVKGKKFISKTF
jgi:hypothetical protein